MSREALLFANLKSGRAAHFAQAIEGIRDLGIIVRSTCFGLDRDAVADALAGYCSGGGSLVLVFGGDGTLGSVVDRLAEHDSAVLGLIAAGTSNNFARSLGIEPGVRSSLEAIRSGIERRIDLGEVNGRRFAHAAIMGLNVDFARYAERFRGVVRRLAYPVASLMVYRNRRTLHLTISDKSESRHVEAYQLAIINAPLAGGCLRAVSVDDLRLRSVIQDLPRIFFERHLGLRGGPEFDLSHAEITSAMPVQITLDGEIRTQTPAQIRVLPDALRVLAPRQ